METQTPSAADSDLPSNRFPLFEPNFHRSSLKNKPFFYFIPFLFPSFFFLSWFALVPLLLAIQGQSYYFLGWICGIKQRESIGKLSQLHWGFGFPLNYLFLLIFGIGTGNILAATFLLFHWLRKNTKISDLLLFPSCLIFAYLPSFAIFNYSLGDTQAQFLYALQAIEWTGIW